jgi:hypothetical protein
MRPRDDEHYRRITYDSIADLDSAIFTLIMMRLQLAAAAEQTFVPPLAPAPLPSSYVVYVVVATETTALAYTVTPDTPLLELLRWIAGDAELHTRSCRFFHAGRQLEPPFTAPLSSLNIRPDATIFVT